MKDVISVWLDRLSDTENPVWIASKDKLDASGNAITTRTLDVSDSYEECVCFAADYAADHGLELDIAEEENCYSVMVRNNLGELVEHSRHSGRDSARDQADLVHGELQICSE